MIIRLLVGVALLGALGLITQARGQDLPIDAARLNQQHREIPHQKIRNLLALHQVRAAIQKQTNRSGLVADFAACRELLDGTTIDPNDIYGIAYAGPYPFEAREADFAYKRFRADATVRRGRTLLPVVKFFQDKYNANDWTDRGCVCVRFRLHLEQDGADRDLGTYDTFVAFSRSDDGITPLPTVVEGPFVGELHSGDPSRVVVALHTSEPTTAKVVLKNGRTFPSSRPQIRHEIALTGLTPATAYRYRIDLGPTQTRWMSFRTAPKPGSTDTPVVFAYTGDSREGDGGGMLAYMGMNHITLERLMALAAAKGADFFIMGGDLVNGYTTSLDDFASQLQAWKQAVTGFWNTRPVYPAMGNHEALLRSYHTGQGKGIRLDRWPYATHSAEAVFAREFLNPRNGPEPDDKRLPPYKENVFSFQYGPVLCIAYNNNYWAAHGSREFGGCPEGYVLDDQLRWIHRQLERAETDDSIRYILLYAQEPVFPNGGHVEDAMWWHGNNAVRARTFTDGKLVPAAKGVVEVRNELVRMVAASSKVAAVLGSDEHAYHRILITKDVPLGEPKRDDRNDDGRIAWPEEACSPLADLKHPCWYLTSGGGGAPYYAEEKAPWNTYWKKTAQDPRAVYTYSSQENILLFRADAKTIRLQVLNPYGECLDAIDDLMACKRE